MNRLLLLLPAMLLLPATASAAPTGTFCDSKNTAICHTVEATDAYETTSAFSPWTGYINSATLAPTRSGEGCPNVWQTREAWVAAGSPKRADTCVKVGTTNVTHLFGKYLFPDVPEQDRWQFRPVSKLYMSEEIVEGSVVHTGEVIINDHLAIPAGSQLGQYCTAYTAGGSEPQPGVALDRTPASIYAACSFTSRQSDAVAAKPPAPEAAKPQALVVPSSAARCGSVGKVTVRSLRVACAPARTIIARYARSLRSPAGWTCRAVVTDAGRRASCTRKAVKRAKVARATVFGIWRP